MTIHVTETQKFIAQAALEVSGADERLNDPALIEDMVRAMLVIEKGRMQAYMLDGFYWSCASRHRQDPLKVTLDRQGLDQSVEWFHEFIDGAREEPARRIRGNRARRHREMLKDAQLMAEYDGLEMDDMHMLQLGLIPRYPANWDNEPRQPHLAQPDGNAA